MEDEASTSIITWISDNMIMLVCGVLALWIMKKCWPNLRQRGFAWFLSYKNRTTDVKLEELKKGLFSPMQSAVSHDPELRKQNAIKILEIGAGSGTNFAHYPDGSRLVVVDPNPYFETYCNASINKFPNIHSEKIIFALGEEMDMVPDNSVDAVVTSYVLCSVKDTKKILQQILRVLVPGGKYYFFEHIREFDKERHASRLKLQDILSVLSIWPFIFDGCYLNRDMLAAIQQAGFAKVQAQRCYSSFDSFIFQVIEPSLKGVAVK